MNDKKPSELRSMRSNDKIFENEIGSYHYVDDYNPAQTLHHHDYYEIVYYFGTEPLRYSYEGREYMLQKGDIVLCEMFREHRYFTEQNKAYARISIGIAPVILSRFSSAKTNLFQLFSEDQPHYPIYRMDLIRGAKYARIIQSYLELEDQEDALPLRHAIVHVFLAQLYMDCCHGMLQDNRANKQNQLLSEVLQYVDTHIQAWITMDQMSAALNYSAGYISRVFKNVTGDNLNQYILRKRIINAECLMESGISIVDAAEQSGFSNYSYFYRAFKKVEGISPTKYLEKRKADYGKV